MERERRFFRKAEAGVLRKGKEGFLEKQKRGSVEGGRLFKRAASEFLGNMVRR